MKLNRLLLGCIFLTMFLVGCSREDGVPYDKTVHVNEPNSFARYLNSVASLPPGDYTVVAATANAGEAGSFTVTLGFDDGEKQIFDDTWVSSDVVQTSLDNPSFDFTLYQEGGIDVKLESSIDTFLYLINRSAGADGAVNRSGVVLASNDNISASDTNSQITLEASRIDSASFGKAYYDAVDPLGAKTTLQGFKNANGFAAASAAGRIFEPRFRDTKDLGYGRGIRGWTKPDGSLYFFVENFQVRSIPGLEYSTLNLDALLRDQRQHHFGSNAIEYSTYPYGPNEPCAFGSAAACATTNPNPPKFLKFFTFDASKGSQTQADHSKEVRLDTVNLDGRGNIAMPGACVYCHGGTLRPLRADTGRTGAYGDGTYRDNSYDGTAGNALNGDTNAKLQLMEVSSFEFGTESPYTQAEQEPIIKEVNKLIYCTYPGADASACAEFCVNPADTVDCDGNGADVATVINNGTGLLDGEWTGDFATTVAEGWYDDPTIGAGTADFDSDTFRQEFVPPGWQPDPSDNMPPPGSDQLFVEVVQPVCFVCHSRRGTSLGSNLAVNGTKDIDFSTYEKFISHADLIEEYVYERGVMPLSLRGYNSFWAGNGPKLLASFLPNFSHANADGTIDKPGSASANAGPDRTTPSPVRLHGSNSRFVSTYGWSIVSTPGGGEDATLTEANTSSPVLTASVDGNYEIKLTVIGGGGSSDEDTVNIKVNNTPTVNPKDLVFMIDLTGSTCAQDPIEICTIFETLSPTGGDCIQCHVQTGGVDGVPVWWEPVQPATGTTWYQEVLARVNFEDPEQSLVLTKPSNNHHYGGLREGFEVDNPTNRQNYDKMLNWIMEGAREN